MNISTTAGMTCSTYDNSQALEAELAATQRMLKASQPWEMGRHLTKAMAIYGM
jgi:hypothetical protein